MTSININKFPYEIFSSILTEAAKLNAQNSVQWTFGLSEPELPLSNVRLHKYVRGRVPDEVLQWDSVADIRHTCSMWRHWALRYALENIHIFKWRTSERWAELTRNRSSYDVYELMDRLNGTYVRQPPYLSLDKTRELFMDYPSIASCVQRIWLNGFYVSETDHKIFDTVNMCENLVSVSIPWTMLRRGTSTEWSKLLRAESENPLQSLELLAVDIPKDQKQQPENCIDTKPLQYRKVNFSKLKRLKIFGNTPFMPVCDADLQAIARTATGLEEIHVSCLSTISIKGLVALVKSSKGTIRVIEHAPRSKDGFYHPHPGELAPDSSTHLCDVLQSCTKLRDLSISMPSVCANLFSNLNVKWTGELQVRALNLCPLAHQKTSSTAARIAAMSSLLDSARDLCKEVKRSHPAEHAESPLATEFFISKCIFTPYTREVHGDFSSARIRSNNALSAIQRFSTKGNYGSSGVYGMQLDDKEREAWEVLMEEEYFNAVEKGWIDVDV
ncbi:MAG: hypothetical protein M1820_006832 [Bogoriella megaspora]|nr:MAG: hypothetical protein M1820_006832 [Bogoriella megaspora]